MGFVSKQACILLTFYVMSAPRTRSAFTASACRVEPDHDRHRLTTVIEAAHGSAGGIHAHVSFKSLAHEASEESTS